MRFHSVDAIAQSVGSVPVPFENRTVHVWGCLLDGSQGAIEQCRAWLSEEERARANRFIRQEDQQAYVLAHGCLRGLLSRYIGGEPSAMMFLSLPTGKPALVDGQDDSFLRFNLSHSHGRMLVAVARSLEVGIDLEQIRDRVDVTKLADRFYAPSECERVIELSGAEQASEFYRLWVAKEAVLKGQGVGLPSLQQCEILPSAEGSRAEVHLLGGAALEPGWTVRWLDCGAGWMGALSAKGTDWAIRAMTSA